jgi:hypothetical protein
MYLPEEFHNNRLSEYRDITILDIIRSNPLEYKNTFNFHVITMPNDYIEKNLDRFLSSDGKYRYRGIVYKKKDLISLMSKIPYKAVLIYN